MRPESRALPPEPAALQAPADGSRTPPDLRVTVSLARLEPVGPKGAPMVSSSPSQGRPALVIDPPPPPSLARVVAAGALGGVIADATMHSVDTVKTRLQAQISPNRYASALDAMQVMKRQEGFRGFYGGLSPAMGGSLVATAVYFGTYDSVKTGLLQTPLSPALSFLLAGALGDLVASVVYVPSEVLKTRLQLQGVYNNPYSMSSYNYKSTKHAIRSMYRSGGIRAFYDGFKATLVRDVPFSALQFMFYESFKRGLLQVYDNETARITPLHDLGTGAAAGALAGGLTTPFDVLKTKLQTQPRAQPKHFESISPGPPVPPSPPRHPPPPSLIRSGSSTHIAPKTPPIPRTVGEPAGSLPAGNPLGRLFSSVRGSSFSPHPASVLHALQQIYTKQGLGGLFRGLAPRCLWAALQSGIMFGVYESLA